MPEPRDYAWIKIVSWHAVETPTRVMRTYRTVCNRRASGETVDSIPGAEKSCESCLRKITKLNEAAMAEQAKIDAAAEPAAFPVVDPTPVVGQGEPTVL